MCLIMCFKVSSWSFVELNIKLNIKLELQLSVDIAQVAKGETEVSIELTGELLHDDHD